MALFRSVTCFSSRISPFSWLLLPAQLHTNASAKYETDSTSIITKHSEQELFSVTEAAGYSNCTARNVIQCAAPKTWKLAGSRLLIFQDVWTPCGVNVLVQGLHSCTVTLNANTGSKGRSEHGSVLAQMVNQKGEQKQLTVADKGRCIFSHCCVLTSWKVLCKLVGTRWMLV